MIIINKTKKSPGGLFMRHCYFLGSTSPDGFKTSFSDIINDDKFYTYILKGGPGTGKSTLMKKVASMYPDETDLYYCSSDTSSLDAIVLNEKKIIVVDGTAPHTFDPVFPGVSQEIVNLGDFWNKTGLEKNKEAIRYLANENSLYHAKARRYIKALAGINNDILFTSANALLTEKTEKYTEKFCRKIFNSNEKSDFCPKEYKQLSAFTSNGYCTCEISDEYKIYTLKDNLFSAGDLFLRKLSDTAEKCGVKCIVSKSYAFNEPIYEHILLPELKIAVMSSNFINNFTTEKSSSINLSGFYQKEIITARKNTLSFDKKVSTEILSEITKTIDTALDIHDRLEKYYIDSLRTTRLNKFSEQFISMINK